MLYIMSFFSISFSMISYVFAKFTKKEPDRYEILAFSLLLLGLILLLGTMGLSYSAVAGSCGFLLLVSVVFQILL